MGGRTYSAFADESSLGDRFLGFGAVFLPEKNVVAVDAALEEFCAGCGFEGREMSWKKCSSSKADRYADFLRLFWKLLRTHPPLDFRAMVLDTYLYPLKAPEFGDETEEDGFYRFYYSFLSRSLAIVAPRASDYELHIALTPDRYKHRTEVLQKTVGGKVGKARGRTYEIVDINRGKPKQHRVHQLADVLLGAVTYRLNDRDKESHKEDLTKVVEGMVGRSLDVDFKPRERPFNVWTFTRSGDRRRAKGARGRA